MMMERFRKHHPPGRNQTDFWGRKSDWPEPPRRFIFLGEALHQVGGHLCGDKWTGDEPREYCGYDVDAHSLDQIITMDIPSIVAARNLEMARRRIAVRPVSVVSSRPSYGFNVLKNKPQAPVILPARQQDMHVRDFLHIQDRLAAVAEFKRRASSKRRMDVAMRWLAAMGREGQSFQTFMRDELGEFVQARPGVWNTEDLWTDRFEACTIAYPGLFVHQRSADRFREIWGDTAFLFLDRDGLAKALAGKPLPKLGAKQKEAWPYLQAMHELIVSGKCVSDAALSIVAKEQLDKNWHIGAEGACKRLERLYPKWREWASA